MRNMLRRKLVYLVGLPGSLLILLGVIWFGVEVVDAGAVEATAGFPGSEAKLVIRLEPNHPYLAEYRRLFILRKDDVEISRLEMSPDTGGFARTQLYRFPDGRIIIQGFLDGAALDLTGLNFRHTFEVDTSGAVYLGAFDKDRAGKWKFMSPNESTEQQLVAGGG